MVAVALAGTVGCFAWSLPLSPWALALVGTVVVGTAILLFAAGDDQGPGIGFFARVLFGMVLIFAAWVAVWGWLYPAQFGQALPVNAPPLHARFLGAMYLSGSAFMLLAMLSRTWSQVAVVVVILAIWTGLLGLVSVLNLAAFNWSRQPTWFWFGAYIGFPIMAAWLAWCQRNRTSAAKGAHLRTSARALLVIIGLAAAVLGLCLMLAPATMTRLWPWAIPLLLAQIYSAPFLAYGAGLLLAAMRPSWSDTLIPVLGSLVFCIGVLTASWLHFGTFSRATPSAWVWFLGFGVSGIALLAIAALPALRGAR